jgi:GDPmannose 4,6-dehydratase
MHHETGGIIFRIDLRYIRTTEVETLLGDPSKAKENLGWIPETTVQEMCKEMVIYDLEQAKQHVLSYYFPLCGYW